MAPNKIFNPFKILVGSNLVRLDTFHLVKVPNLELGFGTGSPTYIATSYGSLIRADGLDFNFRAFSFGDNTVDDTVSIVSTFIG